MSEAMHLLTVQQMTGVLRVTETATTSDTDIWDPWVRRPSTCTAGRGPEDSEDREGKGRRQGCKWADTVVYARHKDSVREDVVSEGSMNRSQRLVWDSHRGLLPAQVRLNWQMDTAVASSLWRIVCL